MWREALSPMAVKRRGRASCDVPRDALRDAGREAGREAAREAVCDRKGGRRRRGQSSIALRHLVTEDHWRAPA